MNKKVITLIGLVIIVIITAAYFYLGGLNKVAYTIEDVTDYNVVGTHFKGKSDSKKMEDAFFKAKDYIDDNTLNGVLTIIHYNDSTLEDGEQKLFIGIKLESGTADLPGDYTRITIPTRRAVRATIEAHNVVMPSPKTIENNLREKALESSISLQDFTIEQYISENLLIIDMVAK